jgi:hypothetical protein
MNTDEQFLADMLADLAEMRKKEKDPETKMKILDREIKLLALKRQVKDNGFGKGFES